MPTHDHGDWRYYLDFFLYPPIVALIAALDMRSAAWLLWFVGGFVFWTFVEYWVHRALLHRIFWHVTHERHHKNPQEFVVFPIWQLPLFFLAVGAGAYAIGLIPVYAGFLAGYVWFLTMHHWLHHIDLDNQRAWLQRYAIWHNRHHKLNDRNYGITTPLWDVLFRTSK